MTREKILNILVRENINQYDCYIVCGCFEAFKNIKVSYKCSFECFCNVVEDIWLDSENTSITTIADCVSDYANENEGLLPESIEDLDIEDLCPMY